MKDAYQLDLKEGVDFRVKRGHRLPRKLGSEYIAFGRTLYCRDEDAAIPRHEFLHLVQFRRYGVPRVVLHYVFHITTHFCRHRNLRTAFREVPFEVEARAFEAGGWEISRDPSR